jgi:hypothetical protein
MPIDLLSRARELSEKNETEKKEARDRKLKEEKYLESQVEALLHLIWSELGKINGQETKYGVLEVTRDNDRSCDVFAYLHVGSQKMAWVKAYIESGTWDPSDDVRNVPYTTAKAKCRIYPPNSTRIFDGSWDIRETQNGFNGGWEFTCDDSQEQVTQFFENFAKGLATWL